MTLLELVAVISILSIVLVMGFGFVVSIAKSNQFISVQSTLMINSQLALERISKELRYSLPYSQRITNNGRCLMFLPVVATGYYFQTLPDSSNGLPETGNSAAIALSSYTITAGNAQFFSVGVSDNTELYGNAPTSLAQIQAFTPSSVTLSNDYQWARNSLAQRFFLTDRANAFCVEQNELRYYSGILPSTTQVNLSNSYDLLASSIQSSLTFYELSSGSDGCRSCVNLLFNFVNDDNQLQVVKTATTYYDP